MPNININLIKKYANRMKMASEGTKYDLQHTSVPEHDGGDGVDCEEEPDDEGIAVKKDFAVLQYGSEGRH